MKINELKAGALLSYVTIAVNNIVGIFYTPLLLRLLGQNEYGLYSLVASVVGYLTILDLGFGNAVIRYTSKYISEGKQKDQYELFGMFFKIYCFIGFFALIIGLILLFNVNYFFDHTMTDSDLRQVKIMMELMIFNIAITFPMSIWGSILTAYEKFVFQKIINIFRIILNAVVMVILLYSGYKAIAMIVVLTIFNVLTLTSNYWYCKHKLNIRLIFTKFNWIYFREIFSYSIFIAIASIVDRIYWSTGQFVIGVYHAPSQIALFAVAVQLQSFYSSFSFAISGVFLPKITKMVTKSNDVNQLSSLFIRVGRLQFYVMSLVFTGFIIFGKKFVLLWAGSEYEPTYSMSIILFSVILLSSIQTLGNNILQAQGDVKFRTVSIFIVSIIIFVLLFPAAKYFSGLGCAVMISLGIFIGHIIILNWYYKTKVGLDIKLFWCEITKLGVLPTIICIAGFHLYKVVLNNDNLFTYCIAILSYVIIFLILIYRFDFNKEEKNLFCSTIKKFIFLK